MSATLSATAAYRPRPGAAASFTAPFLDGSNDFFQLSGSSLITGNNFTLTAWIASEQNSGRWHGFIGNQPGSSVPQRSPSGNAGSFPVEWLGFSAKEEKGEALLEWAIARELNSHYFDVERGSDEHSFSPIGRVKAAGNAESPRSYQFRDPDAALQGSARQYYRLRQVDFDGRFEYSSIVEISLTPANALSLEVYPNPASEEVSIRAAGAAEVQVMALDAAGRQMQAGTLRPGDGQAELKWNVSDWPAGYYTITLQAGQRQTQQKLIVK